MGLDIFAASHLRFARAIPKQAEFNRLEEELGPDKYLGDVYFIVAPNDRAHRSRLGRMKTGLYAYTRASRRHGFRAGSYSGYNWWRNELCRFALGVGAEEVWANPRRFRGRPFVELIDFTDCDGRIGTTVASKLAADFTVHAARAKRHAAALVAAEPDAGWWLENFRDFARSLRLAAKEGALEFC